MDMAIWIFMCLLACIGAVEIFGRFFYGCRAPRGVGRGCLVIPLRHPETARRQLEYYLSFAEWNGLGRPLVFVSDQEEIRQHFERVMGGVVGAYLCTSEQLAPFLEGLSK